MGSLVQTPRKNDLSSGTTSCVFIFDNLKNRRKRFNSQKSGNLLDLFDESLLECTTQLFTIWMMVLETGQEHAENTRYLMMTQTLKSNFGSKNTQNWISSASQDHILS